VLQQHQGDGASCSTLSRQTLLRLPYTVAAKALATDWLVMHRQVPDDCAIHHSPVGNAVGFSIKKQEKEKEKERP
jgi:hypothetical protein